MSQHVAHLTDLLVPHLNELEINNLINILLHPIRQDNLEKFKRLDPAKAFLYALEFMEKQDLLGNNDSSLLIKALEKLNRYDLGAKLAISDQHKNGQKNVLQFKDNSTNPNITVIKINGEDVQLYFQPHQFQIGLAQQGCDGKNNIICLRTGAGKTLIAAIICKYWQAKRCGEKFKALFLVPTRHLAEQQCLAFENVFVRTDLQEIDESMNERSIVHSLQTKSILFLTPQKLVNTLKTTNLKLFDLNAIVFDEAHHTADDHPYNKIMSVYFNEKRAGGGLKRGPLILGLTASLGTGESKNALSHLLKLSANLDCNEIAYLRSTSDINDLNSNISSPLNDQILSIEDSYVLKELSTKFITCIRDIASKGGVLLNKYLPDIHLNRYNVNQCKIGTSEFEQFLVLERQSAVANEERDEIIALKYIQELNQVLMRLSDFHIDFCIQLVKDFYCVSKVPEPIESEIYARNQMKSLIDYMEDNRKRFESNKKLEKLVELIERHHAADSRGLILVRTRQHTRALNEYLKSIKLIIKNVPLNTCVLTGQGSSENLLMNDQEQKNVIDYFKSGIYNLMIATDIAQEGLDVPKCQYVIRYEFVSNEIGTVQSRGRARANNGQCFLITTSKSLNERRELKNREQERQMKLVLEKSNTHNLASHEEYEMHRLQKLKKSQNDAKQMSMTELTKQARYQPYAVKVHCRDCSRELFKGSDLVYREPSYYCRNTRFINSHISIDMHSKKFHCSDGSCRKELGRLVEFRNKPSMYMIEIKGIKLLTPSGEFVGVSKWSKLLEYFPVVMYR